MESLLEYMERPAISLDRLSYREDGLVHYRGSFHPGLGRDHQLVTGMEFLALLVPHIQLKYEILSRAYGAASTTFRKKAGWIQDPPVRRPPPRAMTTSSVGPGGEGENDPMPPPSSPSDSEPAVSRHPADEPEDPFARKRRRNRARLIWGTSNVERKALAKNVETSLSRIEHRLELFNARSSALLEAVQCERAAMRGSEGLPASSALSKAGSATERSPTVDPLEARHGDSARVDHELPEVPAGVSPETTIPWELRQILANERLNPRKKKLGRIEQAEATVIHARAQGMLRVLDFEIAPEAARAIESLRKAGAFSEYSPGEHYETTKGVMTVAESGGERLRLFHLFPEQFGGVYERKRKRAQVAEVAVRELLQIIEKQK